MSGFSFLFLLIEMASLSFFLWVLLLLIDYLNIESKQKLIFHKIGIITLACAPVFSFLLNQFQGITIEISLPANLAGKFSNEINSHVYKEPNFDWIQAALSAYIFGIFLMMSRIFLSFLQAKNQLKSAMSAIIQKHLVYISDNVKSPLSFGILNPKIYFPSNLEKKFTSKEIQICLSHEINHIKNNDPLWKLTSLIVRALIFFVPWSYSLHRRFEREMEIYCDEITRAETGATIQEYGDLLLGMVCIQTKNLIFTNITDSTLKRRFIAMKVTSRKRPLLISILSAILLLMSSVVIAATSGVMKTNNSYKITSKILVDKKLVSNPVIIVTENKLASIVMSNKDGMDSIKIQVIARHSKNPSESIETSFNISIKNKEGTMHSKPVLLLELNKEGKVAFTSDSGHSYEMYVMVEKSNATQPIIRVNDI